MSTDPQDCRCPSSCQVVPGVFKRCIRHRWHSEPHVWIEALNRADGRPQLMEWSVPDAERPDVVAVLLIDGLDAPTKRS